MTTEVFRSAQEPEKQLEHYSLLDALLARRSRRFGKGMRLNGGPLVYESAHEPAPLSLAEEAALAFAACGITGYTMAELPYNTGDVAEAGGGNIIMNFVGRTIFSADAAHLVTLFVLNDDGVWLLKRPQDYPRLEVPELVKAAREHQWLDLYTKSRVRIADQRLSVPREPPFVPPFNKWSANVNGSTYFLPMASHPFGWFQALGFRMTDIPFSRTIGAGPVMKGLLQVLKKDIPVPTALGLERDGQVLIKPFCPPYYRNMEEAVLAFVDYKYAQGRGTLRDGGAATNWQDGAAVQAGIPPYSDRTIAATIACCQYLYSRYGRIPSTNGPFRTLMAYQAHHLDTDFYRKFYRPEVVGEVA
jgi:hypothetical protein